MTDKNKHLEVACIHPKIGNRRNIYAIEGQV